MALLHVSFPPAQACGGEDILYIFIIFPGHLEFWTPLQIPSWGPPLGCTLLQCGGNRQIHMDYQVLWRERDGTATLSRGERPTTLALTGFYCFSGYITLGMVLIYYAQVRFRQLQKTKERVLLIT